MAWGKSNNYYQVEGDKCLVQSINEPAKVAACTTTLLKIMRSNINPGPYCLMMPMCRGSDGGNAPHSILAMSQITGTEAAAGGCERHYHMLHNIHGLDVACHIHHVFSLTWIIENTKNPGKLVVRAKTVGEATCGSDAERPEGGQRLEGRCGYTTSLTYPPQTTPFVIPPAATPGVTSRHIHAGAQPSVMLRLMKTTLGLTIDSWWCWLKEKSGAAVSTQSLSQHFDALWWNRSPCLAVPRGAPTDHSPTT